MLFPLECVQYHATSVPQGKSVSDGVDHLPFGGGEGVEDWRKNLAKSLQLKKSCNTGCLSLLVLPSLLNILIRLLYRRKEMIVH